MPKLALGWTELSSLFLKSPEGMRVGYDEYRQRTGLCEQCGKPMATHPKCEACDLLSGQGHVLCCNPYHGHSICDYCQRAWDKLDEIVGRKTTWKAFLRPEVCLAGKANRL